MITLTTPAAQPSVSTVDLISVFFEVRGGQVTFTYEQTDASGTTSNGRATMTGAAFHAAYAAASGGYKARLHAVFQGLVPAFAGPVT